MQEEGGREGRVNGGLEPNGVAMYRACRNSERELVYKLLLADEEQDDVEDGADDVEDDLDAQAEGDGEGDEDEEGREASEDKSTRTWALGVG